MKEGLIKELEMQKAFILNTINCLSEEDSNFKPNDNMFTVARHIWHVAETIRNASDTELMAPFVDEFIKGAPKLVIVNVIKDHTAHHRGALSVYVRLLGKTPTMPYTGI